jgi:hypothetical protein
MTPKWSFEIILLKEKLNRKPIHHLRAVLFIFFILLSFACQARAQNSQQIRRLPPSLERELKLKHGGKIRIVGFVDTLKAQNIIAQSIRDSASEELDSLTVKDSAIIMIDSSVSLNDKEWLDSMLAQLPEYKMTPEGIRFYYPADILIETNRKVVPPDTTLPSKMDPVTKEDLPLYSELPMPKPFQKIELPRTSLELGAGFPYLPRVDVRSLVLSNEKSAVEVNGKFKTTSAGEPAIKQYLKFGINGSFAFPDAAMPVSAQTPQLDVQISTGVNKRMLQTIIDSTTHLLSQTELKGLFTIGSSEQLRLHSEASMSFLDDAAVEGSSEVQGSAAVYVEKNVSESFRLNLNARFQRASNIGTTNILSGSPTFSPYLIESKVLLEEKEYTFNWKAGFSYLNGNDLGGNTSLFSPIVYLNLRLSHSFEIGANFEPQNMLVTIRDLNRENIFYSPAIAIQFPFINDFYPADKRRIVSEPVHINLFAHYYLSLNNEIHAELRFIQRKNEPVFYQFTDNSGQNIFQLIISNTVRWELECGGNVQYFQKDLFSFNGILRAAYNRDTHENLSFVPRIQFQGSYELHRWENFIPKVELVELVRPEMRSFYLNLDAKYLFSSSFQLKFRTENIFGSAGDFWPGYNEYPRSIWLSGQYNF